MKKSTDWIVVSIAVLALLFLPTQIASAEIQTIQNMSTGKRLAGGLTEEEKDVFLEPSVRINDSSGVSIDSLMPGSLATWIEQAINMARNDSRVSASSEEFEARFTSKLKRASTTGNAS